MKDIREKLKEKTKRSDEECNIINDILNNHFIIGHNNKKKIIGDFIEKLNISESDADELYNTCSEIIVKGIFRKN